MLNKLLVKLQQKYSNSSLFKDGGLLAPEPEEERAKKIKLPVFRLMFYPFNQILDNGKIFFSLTLLSALFLSMDSTLFGFNYLCIYTNVRPTDLYCSDSFALYAVQMLIKIAVFGYVAYKWSAYVYEKKSFSFASLFRLDKTYLKTTACLLILLIINSLPLFSSWILYIREPNPDWQIEMIFFAFVSIGYVLPFVALRYYPLLGFVLRGKKLPQLGSSWQKTSGNMLRILFGLLVIFILSVYLFSNMYGNFRAILPNITLYNQFLAEYIYDFVILFLFLVLLNNINVQYEIFYAEENGENSAR